MGGGRFAFARTGFCPYGEPSRHPALACWHDRERGKLAPCEPHSKHRPTEGRARGRAAGSSSRLGFWLCACNWPHRSCRPTPCRGRCALPPSRQRRRRNSRRPALASAPHKRGSRFSPVSMSFVPSALPWPRRRAMRPPTSPLSRLSPGKPGDRPCRQSGWSSRRSGQQRLIPRRRRPWPCCRLLPKARRSSGRHPSNVVSFEE